MTEPDSLASQAPHPTPWPERILRMLAGVVLVAASALVFANLEWFRSVEAMAATPVVGLFVPAGAATDFARQTVYLFGDGASPVLGFVVSGGCSVGVLVALLLLASSPMALISRFNPAGVLWAVLAAVCVSFLANVVRTSVIAVVGGRYGREGAFFFVHNVGGAVFIVVMATLSVVVLFKLLLSGGRRVPVPPRETVPT
ncbi:exosortase/archaeosortase family protein [Lentzea atacamensis]|uniref:Exosortase/archaeosortase family protein n=2 Tax=Lentzea TaxID=165301 RepID=A0A316HVZ9_9PSEU|nr:exosortase/archaeosortase family protein [Lentzea atacamensis]PWK84866.1 exosortase/archaeosortase family protein [Lentzea atacamensis]RAS65896.1 exosortase/archaeosortase family protein [Lentzea atacamensis]